MKSYLLLIAGLLGIQWKIKPESQLVSPANATCACPGEVLTYTCTVEGGNVTIWSGSIFDCPENEIVLYHDQFDNGTSGECNDGAIIGQSVDVFGAYYYISQLNVIVSNELNNKTVNCSSDSETVYNSSTIGESWINVADHSAPDIIYLSDASEDKLEFSWTPVVSNTNCSSLRYNITSDCGTCPFVTSETVANCYDLQLTTSPIECYFRVSSVVTVCDLPGDPSSPVAVILKVPNAPQAKLIPSYSNDSQALEMVYIITTMIEIDDLFNISGNISGSPTSYTTHVSNPVSGSSFNSTVELYQSSCEEASKCLIELPDCSQSTIIDIAISAANILGEGPPSKFVIECTNTFIQVLYREASSESTISCVFLNPSDTSEKTCCVIYQLCDQERIDSEKAPECNKIIPNEIELKVSVNSNQTYCYTVTASNDTYTVKVEGKFTTGLNQGGNGDYAVLTLIDILVGVLIFLIIAILIAIVVIVIIILRRKFRRSRRDGYQYFMTDKGVTIRVHPQDVLKQYLAPYDLNPTLHEVPRDCKLQEFVTEGLNVGFRRGHTYYEFTNEVENIPEGKEVLLQERTNLKTNKWFHLDQARLLADGRLELYYGEGIARSSFGEQYRVFIQSLGSGARHLRCDSWIIYNHSKDQVEPDVLPLVPVCSEHFAHKVIDSEEGLSAQQFCTENRLSRSAFNIFLTVKHLPEGMKNQPPLDVILMDRESRKLFTGPFARQMCESRIGGEVQHNEKWKIFVLLGKNKQDLVFQKNSEVLYQDSRCRYGKYSVLEVDADCVRMSKFIEKKLGNDCQYEDRKAFYEAEKDEDLLYYKKILRPQKEELSREQVELQSLVEYFYAIDGVPAKAVKLDDLRHSKIFIQSTSQGSRCLKKGDKLLYLKEYISSSDRKPQVDQDETPPIQYLA